MNTAILTQQPISVANFTELVKDFTRSTAISMTYFVDDSRSRTIKGTKQVQKLVRVKNAISTTITQIRLSTYQVKLPL